MDAVPPGDRGFAEAALGHPVPVALGAGPGGAVVAASVAGDPPRARVAWVGPTGAVLARVATPPARPSRWRPVVAATVTVEMAPELEDRILVARAAPEAAAVLPVLATDEPVPPVPVGGDGLALARIPAEVSVVAVDALDARGEPIGRLGRPGISELTFDGASIGGRMGATHGMAAGIGAGRWARGLGDAAFEVGYDPWLPRWVPDGLERGRPRVEPDVAYPAAPPAIVIAWAGEGGGRVLLRQAPAPLASPDGGGFHAREVPIGEAVGKLRSRGLVTLVWETPDRAFGLQVRGIPDGDEVAVRVARSIAP
ncbi:MAG TPA: hypothetical protein VFG74_16660 [Miltoncostaeaceae bacterium]|jgi:hypothetical protein|nr:hypothetical protein [Miltoncostaeaceae bacterium]